MSLKIAARSTLILQQSCLKAGAGRVFSGTRTNGFGLRFASVQAAQGLHRTPSATRSGVWRYPARSAGLAVALAGSLGLVVMSSRLETLEKALPAFVKELVGSTARIQDLYSLHSDATLGHGQFGSVSKATDKATGEVMAVKIMPRGNASEAHFREETDAHREVENHPNIVGLKGIFTDEENYYIVMELAGGGELYDRLTAEGDLMREHEVRSVMREAADAIAYMHERGIVHGDVKPENMLLSSVQNASSADGAGGVEAGVGKVLLADFGSSFRVKGAAGAVRRATKEYTAAYSAPEVVSNEAVDQKADIWSLGVIAYVMVMGHHPFDPTGEASDEEIMNNIVNSEPDWDGFKPQAGELVRQMLSRDPAVRPSARKVLQSAWLQMPTDRQAC